jgi:hypothetical protein
VTSMTLFRHQDPAMIAHGHGPRGGSGCSGPGTGEVGGRKRLPECWT